MEVDSEVDIDEQVAGPVQGRADAVSRIGGDQHPLKRRGLLTRDERLAHAHPDQRGAGIGKAAAHEPILHRRVVADLLAGRREGPGQRLIDPRGSEAGAKGRRGGADQPGTVGAGQPRRNLDLLRAQSPRRCPDHRAVGVRQAGLDELDAAAGAHDSGLDPQRGNRHRTQDLEGDPPDVPISPALEPLDLAADQAGGRAGVLGVGIPRAPGQLGGGIPVPVGNEEGLVGHARDRMRRNGRRAGRTKLMVGLTTHESTRN